MTAGIPGSAYRPHDDTVYRLDRWRRLATAGHPVADIAAALGMTRAALDQMVVRARRRGHPDAILHPRATWSRTGRTPRTRTTGGTT